MEKFKEYEKFNFDKTEFVGYETLKTKSTVLELFDSNYQSVKALTGEGYVFFDKTPFYAMSGGQASDQGIIKFKNQQFDVIDVRKDLVYGYFIHQINLGDQILKIGDVVETKVDSEWRRLTSINHSSIHIMWQSTIKNVGHYIYEIGSKLDKYKYQLQFENDELLTEDLVMKVTNIFNNEIIPANIKSNIFNVTQAEAIEKEYLYEFTKISGDELVRMVEFPGIVIEPCSGTHVDSTGEIKQTWFLDFDKNSKRTLIEMTSNPDYANEYFTAKLNTRLEEIKATINRGVNNNINYDFKELLNEAESLLNQWNYLSIKRINEIHNEIILIVNKYLKELERDLVQKINQSTFEFNSVGNYLILETAEDLYTNKMFLSKISQEVSHNPEKVIVFINKSSAGVNTILMRNKNLDINLKLLLANILENTKFNGGGTESMIQLTSNDSHDLEKLKEILR
ncbi:alanine--tRNA ligase-related protein [Mesoplasma photuris]|uniref:alanine--tRNA ligase-related protein n=1 Tax=Mesoplasma photuris TaxID=217731 RepID=UPI0004E208A8|nr:alanine--tRNA ligase-related protein [Mesoplasma photuris]